MRSFLAILSLCFAVESSYSQDYYRIQADISIKEELTDSSKRLSVGTVYYDKNEKSLLYVMTFPEEVVIAMIDTMTYMVKNGKVISAENSGIAPEYSIYAILLNERLQYFGLKESPYVLTDMKKEGQNLISRWEAPKRSKVINGELILSQRNGKLDAIISKNKKGVIIARQFFKEYQHISGLNVPTSLVQAMPFQDGELYKWTTLKNIQVNNDVSSEYYNYKLPSK